MTALELMERLGGEILNNKVRATIDGEIVILARLNDQDWVFTDKGQELANLHSNLAVDEASATTKTRKTKQAQVESVETQPEQEPQADAEQPAAE